MFEQLGLIGCGLIGGSFALALRQAGLVKRVIGYSKSPTTTDKARQLGVIDVEAPSALQAASGSDLILLAVPVASTEATLRSIREMIDPQVLVMDAGSTKQDVVDAARRTLKTQLGSFVPAHPVAGREVSGVENADAGLFRGRQVVLTPLERTKVLHLDRAQATWEAMGAKVVRMSPEAHDCAFAAISHLPHLIAFAAMNGLLGQEQGADLLAMAGPGFRDFSRIAASEPAMWRDVLLANRQQVLAQSKAFKAALEQLEALIDQSDHEELERSIRQASAARANWRMGAAQAG